MRLPDASFRRTVLSVLVLPLVLSVCFHRLITAPASILVDGRRPSVDHAVRGRARGIGNDLTTVFLPRYAYVVGHSRANGKWPLWDSSGFGGRPLIGNPQAGLSYPPAWAAYRAGRASALGWLTVLHLAWGGLGAFVLSRSLGLGRPASAFAGGCFEASPYLIAHTFEGHYPHVWSACWYPWAFWACNLALREKWLGLWLLPVVLSLTFLTGHPQEWYYLVVALSLWVVSDVVRVFRTGRRAGGVRRALIWGGVVAVSLGLAAIELVPELYVRPWLLNRSVIPLELVHRYHLHSRNLLQLLSPFALGRPETYWGHDNYWETVLSIGLAPLLLLVLGVSRAPERKALSGWGWLVVGAVVFAAGRKLGLFSLAYALLPGMDRFRVPARTLFLASLGASVLAASGAERLSLEGWTAAQWRTIRRRLLGGLLIVGSVVVVLLTRDPSPAREPTTLRGFPTATSIASQGGFWISLLGVIAVVSWAGSHRRGQVGAAWGLGVVALIELSFTAQSLLVCSPAAEFVRREGIGAVLRQGMLDPSGPGRIATLGTVFPDLKAAREGLEKTNVNDGFQIQHAADLYETLYPFLDPPGAAVGVRRPRDADGKAWAAVARKVLDLMNVRCVVGDVTAPMPGLVRTDDAGPHGKGPVIWSNPTALPRAYVVPRAVVRVGDAATLMETLYALNPREAVVMSGDPLVGTERQPFTPAEWVSGDPDVVTIRVETSAPGLLVVGNTWMPGWEATVDANPAPVWRGNHWQQVVAIPKAGRHEIVITYRPRGLWAGTAVTLATLAGWGGLGLVLCTRPLRQREWWVHARPRCLAALKTCPTGRVQVRPSRAACAPTIRA